jgi:hypothetical protein
MAVTSSNTVQKSAGMAVTSSDTEPKSAGWHGSYQQQHRTEISRLAWQLPAATQYRNQQAWQLPAAIQNRNQQAGMAVTSSDTEPKSAGWHGSYQQQHSIEISRLAWQLPAATQYRNQRQDRHQRQKTEKA